jgi:hypothetical protein
MPRKRALNMVKTNAWIKATRISNIDIKTVKKMVIKLIP